MCAVYKEACSGARRWIEEATKITFPCEDFRESLKDGMLLCKLIEKLSGINIGQLNPIPRSLAWMDNLVIFLNICRYMGLKKSQLFGVDDLVGARNQAIPVKVKQNEDDRRLRNVLVTIFWLGRLAYSLEDYQGPLPQLDAFEVLINKNRPPEMVDQRRNKFELDTLSGPLSGSGTWPKVTRSSRSRDSNAKEGSLEYFEHMRRQLIPRLTANVKEKAVMYEKIQQQAATHDHAHAHERRRSYHSLKTEDDHLTGKTAKRAHSFGALNTPRNHKPNNENKNPFYTGSITRRTPVKVNQSHIQKEEAKRYPQDPVETNRTERSFQYDTKPIIKVKIPSSQSQVSIRRKTKRDDHVSVKAMIKQWSDPVAKGEIQSQSQPIHHEVYRDRRSLPANFNGLQGDVSSERKEFPHMHHKSHKDCKASSNRSMDTRLSSEVNRGLSDAKQKYFAENRTNTRRKSEPSNYSRKEYDSLFTERNRSSSMRNGNDRDDANDRYFKEREREGVVKESKTTNNTYAAISYPQQQFQKEEGKVKDTKNKERIPVSNRRSFPFTQRTEVKHVKNYMDQKLYQPKNCTSVDRRKLESIGKYATMPARRVRVDRDEHIVGKNEKSVERTSDINWDKMNMKTDDGKASGNEHSQRRSAGQRSPSLHRRLPTYEEAIIPLHEIDTVDAAKTNQTDNKKIPEKEHVSISHPQHQTVSNKGKSTTVAAREVDYSLRKQRVNENVQSKQHVTHVNAVYPVLTSKDVPRKDQMIPKRRHSKEGIKDNPSIKQTVVLTNRSSGTSLTKSSNERTPHQNESSYIKDVNNNKLPVYDGEALQTMLTTQQRSSRNNSNKQINEKDTMSKVNESFVRKDTKPKKENRVVLNEYESLREAQQTILDEDFKDRGRIRMDPNVAQQLTNQGGVNFSNVVHEGELLELVAAEEKYWKNKVDRKEKSGKEKEMKTIGNTNDKQERVNKMLQELKTHDQKEKIDYSEITDTLRAEEEFLAQEAEKLLKKRFEEKSAVKPTSTTKDLQFDVKRQPDYSTKRKSSVDGTSTVNSGLHSILKTSTRQKQSPSVTSSDDINLKPEADQAYQHHNPRQILRTRSPVYICSGCRLPVEKDICLFVAELQSYWHEKCFRCSVCHSNLIQDDQTPTIRVMFSRIHCERCLSNKKTGGQSTMV